MEPGFANRVWQCCRVLAILALAGLVGCGGCRRDGEQLSREELEKRAKEKRESLVMGELMSLPSDSETKILYAKPGHWHETQQTFKSNLEELRVMAVGSVARGSELAKIPGTNFVNEFTRRTVLPKGQTKTIDLQYFVPFSSSVSKDIQQDPMQLASRRLTFRTELYSYPLMTPILQAPNPKPANELLEHEFQLIALGPQALSYGYLTALDAVFWRGEEFMIEERTRSYFVSLVKPQNNRYAFPRSMITMTSIAAIVWDDVSPDELSEDQQKALIDWVHWGGQLIVSGPSSWSRLQSSFLSPYLPAVSAEAIEYGTDNFSEISTTWAVEDRADPETREPLKIEGSPIGGLRFSLAERGQWLPGTGEMVAESQVGRGRIALTAFPLRDKRIFQWKYFSSFFSTGLLRRHSRTFRRSSQDRMLAQYWTAPYTDSHRDARLHSNIRILTRDLPLATAGAQQVTDKGMSGVGGESFRAIRENEINAPSKSTGQSAEAMQWGGRAAAWNDYSGLSYEALNALKQAAGIELPSRKTIIYLLAGYLLCLVPLNWLLFRLIGRLEFAWIAAPLMAIAGVVVVTKVARLDIGFARRTTEISVLELHEDHNRGHLTQYLALYTSLSTPYSVDFPENGSVALPIGDISKTRRRASAEIRNLRTNYGRSEGVTLEPLTVYSNSTEMLHAEQVVDLAGGLRLGRLDETPDSLPALKNDTGLNLRGAMVLRRTTEDQFEIAWLGDLASSDAKTIDFQPITIDRLWENWKKDPVTQPNQPEQVVGEGTETNALWIGGVLKEIVRRTPLMQGQTRLFAFSDDQPSRLAVSPEEDQFDGRCIVVAHLTPMKLGEVTPDATIVSRMSSASIDERNKQQLDEELKDLMPEQGEL